MGLFWKFFTAPDEEASERVMTKALFHYLTGKKDGEKKSTWSEKETKGKEGSEWLFGKKPQPEKKSWFK